MAFLRARRGSLLWVIAIGTVAAILAVLASIPLLRDDDPGTQGPMHRHTADEIFYCVQGECTFTLEGGRREKLKPGMVVFIPKHDYYKLENTGSEYLILLGMRSEPSKLARLGPKGETVGANTWALENRFVIAAKKRAIAAKRVRTGSSARKPAAKKSPLRWARA